MANEMHRSIDVTIDYSRKIKRTKTGRFDSQHQRGRLNSDLDSLATLSQHARVPACRMSTTSIGRKDKAKKVRVSDGLS